MQVEKTFINGLLIIKPDVFEDSRGYFFETFNKKKYEQVGIDADFVQDNVSKSNRGTIRGLHYQVGKF
ncbi:MAG: dTDP-4-dehydrorhamnose 3,5-epimerase family protein, partial [Melioribacteraceae bacterium]|nr:dTDP-4-dehydrorhamnose 3,5-epimerase family protein [Melioribacteraceae bacterium]